MYENYFIIIVTSCQIKGCQKVLRNPKLIQQHKGSGVRSLKNKQ